MSSKPKIQILLSACLVCLLEIIVLPPAHAASLENGLQAYKTGDYETALKELEPLARRGHVKAQYSLGQIYYARKGELQDPKEAIKWFTKAAEQKDAFSQFTLGQMYAQENRIYKDYLQAFAWYTLALSQGNESARKGRESVLMKMTPEQVLKGQELYKQIYTKIYGGG